MTHSELVHRYFDEGLEGSLEDVLFESLGKDSDLRREFSDHMKIHSFVRSDMQGITAPAATTHKLFSRLGLQPPAGASAQVLSSWAATELLFRRATTSIRNRMPYVYTALVSAAVTSFFFILSGTQDYGMPGDEESGRSVLATEKISRRDTGVRIASSRTSEEKKISFTVLKDETIESRSIDPPTERILPDRIETADANTAGESRMAVVIDTSEAEKESHVALVRTFPDRRPGIAQLQLPATMTNDTVYAATRNLKSPEPAEKENMDHHLFTRTAATTPISNIVIEMRMLNSRSYPEVDLPHDSHDHLSNIAVSAVYKVSDRHAFGIEYGREGFGQEYESLPQVDGSTETPMVQGIFTSQRSWIPGLLRENRLLDWYGVVWKASFPELGLFGLVYPYTRTVVGATRQGPIGRLRLGLEYFPTNFAMLNFGVEGSMLKYKINNSWYETNKLGVTLGVAIGF